jgi:hypothetical protein
MPTGSTTITIIAETSRQRRWRAVRLTLGLLTAFALACSAAVIITGQPASHLRSEVAAFSASAPLVRMTCAHWEGLAADDSARQATAAHLLIAYLQRHHERRLLDYSAPRPARVRRVMTTLDTACLREVSEHDRRRPQVLEAFVEDVGA